MDAVSANIAARLAERARELRSRPALIEHREGQRRVLTYAELDMRIASLAHELRHFGVGPGVRVLLAIPMSIHLYVQLLAIFHAGATAVFVDAWAGRKRVDDAVRRTRPRVFVGTRRAVFLLRFLSPAVRAIPEILVPDHEPKGEWPGGMSPEPLDADAPALVTFTTGSTGNPKASLRTHGFLWDQHLVLSRHLGPEEGGVDMPTLPIFVLHNLAAGATSVLPDFDPRHPAKIDAARIRAQIVAEGVQTCVGSPAFFDRLLDPRGPKLPLRKLFTGGAPVLPGLARKLEAGTEGEPWIVYGSTEAEPISLITAEEMLSATGEGICVGKPVPEIALRLVAPRAGEIRLDSGSWAGVQCAPGEAGEIVVSGPQVQTKYFDDVTSDHASKIEDGATVWHRTGDGGRLDAQGRLWLLGRVGARVTLGGRTYWSLPAEVAAMQMDGVSHAAYLESRGRAILCLEAPRSNDWLERARARLAPYPVDDVIALKRIPRDPRHASKTNMAALRAQLGLPES
jgi:acyl-CoA synthetase (AMP-forming)/AMP-acid ligase II